MTLLDRARKVVTDQIEKGELETLLGDCIRDGGINALSAVQLLAEDMYGGLTFNFELKAPAAYALCCWGPTGCDAVVEMATRTPTSKNVSLCMDLLASLAAGDAPWIDGFVRDPPLAQLIRERIASHPNLRAAARERLAEYVLAFPNDEDAVDAVGKQLSHFRPNMLAAREAFAVLALRWLAIGAPVVKEYEELIVTQRNDEPSFQRFLEAHAHLIDPMAVTVWPEPNIVGARKPDFVVRRADDSYLVVEIEVPGKQLVTGSNQLSADATHAIAQATDYKQFLAERFDVASRHFPNFREPDCLVVIGLESELNAEQRGALLRANQNLSRVRVVGFDWLAKRAEAIRKNTIETLTAVDRIRVL